MLTFQDIRNNEAVRIYIQSADSVMNAMKFTEHGFAHAGIAAQVATHILKVLGYDARTCELASIAGYMHDIGNIVNRHDHAQSGAVMAFRILDKLGCDPEELSTIVSAIGNHDEKTAFPVNEVAAAIILGDKTDVRRSRVRNQEPSTFDIHDRVNFAVSQSCTILSEDKKSVTLDLSIDSEISPVLTYFEIFMDRMLLCRKAAERLNLDFHLCINGQNIL